jgi:hypothetical protein
MSGAHRSLLGALTLSAALLAAAACGDSPVGPTTLKTPVAKARTDCIVYIGWSSAGIPMFAVVPYDPGDGSAVSCWGSDTTQTTRPTAACWAYSTVDLTCDDGSSWSFRSGGGSNPGSNTPTSITVNLSSPNVGESGQVTVTAWISPPVPGYMVNFTSAEVANSGGHVHTGRPVGSFSAASGVTSGLGGVTTTYTVSVWGGAERIQASVGDISGGAELGVVVESGLEELGPGSHYILTGQNSPNGTHPYNHYGTPTANGHLVDIANAYAALYPGGVLDYNDQSLVLGGRFDIGGYWNGSAHHDEHRHGINCDIGFTSTEQREAMEELLRNNGSPNFKREPDRSHWHARFEF